MSTGKIIRVLVATAVVLLVPLVAMRFTDEVVWTISDFVVAGTLLLGAGLLYELAASRSERIAYRAAAGLAVAAALLLVWINLAVGVIGTENNPANLLYAGVLAVALSGVVIARGRPNAMAVAMVATAIAQVLVGVIALTSGLEATARGWLEIMSLSGLFAALWVVSGLLFRCTGIQETKATPAFGEHE